METFKPYLIGVPFKKAVDIIVATANESQEPVQMEWEGLTFVAEPGETLEKVSAKYYRLKRRRAKGWESSPEKKLQDEVALARYKKEQMMAVQLMQELPVLDFSNLMILINYLGRMERAGHQLNVLDRKLVVGTFKEHGFFPGVNVDNEHKADDMDNVARYIIGQALKGLQEDDYIMQIYHAYAGAWHKKFHQQMYTI